MSDIIFRAAWDAALLCSATYVFWKGERDERLLMVVFLVASIATALLMWSPKWPRMELGPVIIGLIVTFVFGSVSMTTCKWWPLWATSFQIISTIALLAPGIDRLTRLHAAYFSTVGWDYLTLLAMVVGVRTECRSRTLGAILSNGLETF